MKLLLLFLFCHVSSPVKHSLEYLLTASSGVPDFPDFVGTSVVDDILVANCNTNEKIVEPKQDWMKKIFQHFPGSMEAYTQMCLVNLPYGFKATIFRLKQDLNQTGGIHTLQARIGCEWDDETGEVNGFNQYGYDGEDLMSFDLKTLTWIAAKPQAVITKITRNASRYVVFDVDGIYVTQICPYFLKIYVSYGNSVLLRTDLPSVSLLQKSPSSPVSCHATGFYPNRAMMFWRKDGEEIHEDVDIREILPNHDGSFQMSVDLNLSSVPPEDWRRYDCVFHLSGVKDDIITKLDKAVIRTNLVSPSQSPAGPVIGVVVGLLLLLALCITGIFLWRRNHHGFRPANNSSSQLDNTLALTDDNSQ
ncbi:major histocompatibility complex class I-related gene protein-like [Epinephelus fuscoguttatus]|uniref:major histocompatibility complex class I-related gene protein-like n=1 Tax=Epinephelus fuscoguttatus TaxID=293821 RepID=UPI0020D1D94F|nr:major histocompatibility complex class I-related gene protein-like [Epinephelus fuscoguttatus]